MRRHRVCRLRVVGYFRGPPGGPPALVYSHPVRRLGFHCAEEEIRPGAVCRDISLYDYGLYTAFALGPLLLRDLGHVLTTTLSWGCIRTYHARGHGCSGPTCPTDLFHRYADPVGAKSKIQHSTHECTPVTSIARHISHKIEAWPAKLRTFHIAPREDAYRFHRPPADQDTPHPRGHWSTSSAGACAQGEYVIPAATSEAEFHAYPGVELDGFRVKALADAEPRRVEYKIRVLDERIVTSASAGLA
ncbi:hypothetical protein PLICRDRAFT_496758 [Plicaturopsis crispa FD-325 SS-3]|nr:hypothetical protein PLICRDRAFT_496758 [Plicaturopsis crispa FD-325 SS-3]